MVTIAEWIEGTGLKVPKYTRIAMEREELTHPLPHTQLFLKNIISFIRQNKGSSHYTGFCDTYYPNVPKEMHDLLLWQFATSAEMIDKDSKLPIVNSLQAAKNEMSFTEEVHLLSFESDMLRFGAESYVTPPIISCSKAMQKEINKTKGAEKAVIKHELHHLEQATDFASIKRSERKAARYKEEFDADKCSISTDNYEAPAINAFIRFDNKSEIIYENIEKALQQVRMVMGMECNQDVADQSVQKFLLECQKECGSRVRGSAIFEDGKYHPSPFERIHNLMAEGIKQRAEDGLGRWK